MISLHQVKHVYDAAANDSDKTWVIPDNEIWLLDWFHVIFTSTATVGNRQINIVLTNGDDTLQAACHTGIVQAASLTRHYSFQKGIFRESSFINDAIQVPIPPDLVSPGGWKIRVYDTAAVDAAADDMTVSFQYQYA